jgi:hypothetical protein
VNGGGGKISFPFAAGPQINFPQRVPNNRQFKLSQRAEK